jgi:hypothetical protein
LTRGRVSCLLFSRCIFEGILKERKKNWKFLETLICSKFVFSWKGQFLSSTPWLFTTSRRGNKWLLYAPLKDILHLYIIYIHKIIIGAILYSGTFTDSFPNRWHFLILHTLIYSTESFMCNHIRIPYTQCLVTNFVVVESDLYRRGDRLLKADFNEVFQPQIH